MTILESLVGSTMHAVSATEVTVTVNVGRSVAVKTPTFGPDATVKSVLVQARFGSAAAVESGDVLMVGLGVVLAPGFAESFVSAPMAHHARNPTRTMTTI